MKMESVKAIVENPNSKRDTNGFNPFRLISDEDFCINANVITAYYQMIKGGKTTSKNPKGLHHYYYDW
jgi:hypothetical protein